MPQMNMVLAFSYPFAEFSKHGSIVHTSMDNKNSKIRFMIKCEAPGGPVKCFVGN